jgi:hypothetical protein
MMMRYLLFILAIACLPLAASTQWTTTDTILEVASEAGLAGEWAQMTNAPSICGIDQKIMGAHPKRANLNMYFAGWLIAHPLISMVLPGPYRNAWQGATIGFEIVVNQRNAAVGCRIHF